MVAFEKRVVRPSPIVLAAQLFCLIVVTQATSVLEAYRLVQYDLDGVSSGSRTARLAQVCFRSIWRVQGMSSMQL